MKKRSENKMRIPLKMLLTALLPLLLFCTCNRNSKVESEKLKLISEKSLESILTDIYLANGLLSLPEIKNMFSKRDSNSMFIDIIESHGYTYEAMNKTMEYYFFKKPKKLIKIYDEVLGRLSEMEARYQNPSADGLLTNKNHWQGKSFYTFPDPAGAEKADFSVPIYSMSTYILEFSVVVYPDDHSVNPGFLAWYCNFDSVETGKRTFLPVIKYIKDGFPHAYTITDEITINHPVVLKGSLIDYENNLNDLDRHARISDITLSITTNPL